MFIASLQDLISAGLLFISTDIISLTGLSHQGQYVGRKRIKFVKISPVGTKYFLPDTVSQITPGQDLTDELSFEEWLFIPSTRDPVNEALKPDLWVFAVCTNRTFLSCQLIIIY